MNREDIIRMYEEANGWSPAGFDRTVQDLERFAALVAAAEREACAKVCEELGMTTNGIYERNYECAIAIRARGQA